MHAATGVARGSILAGLKELKEGIKPVLGEPRQIRKACAGRKKLIEHDPDLREALEKLVEPATRGDPESPLRWTCKSLTRIEKDNSILCRNGIRHHVTEIRLANLSSRMRVGKLAPQRPKKVKIYSIMAKNQYNTVKKESGCRNGNDC